MKAAVLNAVNGGFVIEDIEIAEPVGREVLVQVKASGLCHSDLHVAEAGHGVPLPAVLGHELAGVVKALGPEVSEFAVGDHVVGSLIAWCGHCGSCLDGETYRCEHPETATCRGAHEPPRLSRGGDPVFAGFGAAAFAEYALIHENQLVKVPEAMPFPQASLLGCACITGLGAAVNSADIATGDCVAVIGIGGVGLNVISGARLRGAGRIIAIDLNPAKEALARKFGATDFIAAGEGDVIAQARALTGRGVDHVFEVVGLKQTFELAIKIVRRGGVIYVIGVHSPGSFFQVDPVMDMVVNQITIKGVSMGSSNIKRDIPTYVDLYLQGRLNLDDLISNEINIAQINDAYETMKTGAIARNVITSF